MHFDPLRGMTYGETGKTLQPLPAQFFSDQILVADQYHLEAVFLDGQGGSFDFSRRGVIPPHSVQRDFHLNLRLFDRDDFLALVGSARQTGIVRGLGLMTLRAYRQTLSANFDLRRATLVAPRLGMFMFGIRHRILPLE